MDEGNMKKILKASLGFFLFFLCCGSHSNAADNPAKPIASVKAQNIVKIDVRPDVTVRLAIFEPSIEPKGIALLFPGGNGAGENSFGGKFFGKIGLGHNFNVRTAPSFAEWGYVVAIMDAPSDKYAGMSPGYRASPQHHADIKTVIKYLKDTYKQKPLFLSAFSMSNVSVASISAKNDDLNISGVILLSGVWKSIMDKGLIHDYAAISYPVFIVHHVNDACSICPFESAKTYFDLLKTKGRKDLLAVTGGTPYPQATVCGPLHYHGYPYREDSVVKAIVDWMDGKEVPKEIK